MLGTRRVGGVDHVVVLLVRDEGLRLRVDRNVAADNSERIARQSDAALDVVLFLVDRTRDDRKPVVEILARLPVVVGIAARDAAAYVVLPHLVGRLAQDVVVARLLELHDHRVALGEVEYHDVVALDAVGAGKTSVRTLHAPAERRFGLGHGHGVVDERKFQRRARQLGAVVDLRDHDVVARHKGALHRAGRDDVHLEYELMDERCYDHGEDDSVHPLVELAVERVAPFELVPEPVGEERYERKQIGGRPAREEYVGYRAEYECEYGGAPDGVYRAVYPTASASLLVPLFDALRDEVIVDERFAYYEPPPARPYDKAEQQQRRYRKERPPVRQSFSRSREYVS